MSKQLPWRNRIVRSGEAPAGSFLANERNWRVHPKAQQDALSGVLDDVGWVQDVVVNLRTSPEWGDSQNVETMVDGHARVVLALRRGEDTPVPVTYVDLTPAEEALVLATLDPIAAMAAADKEQLDALLRDVETNDEAVQKMLMELAEDSGLSCGKQPPNDTGPQTDKAEELRAKWQTQRGATWACGRHRVMCGDSSDISDVKTLLAGAAVDIVVTDPPYDMAPALVRQCLENFAQRAVILVGGKMAFSLCTDGWEYSIDLVWKHRKPRTFPSLHMPVFYHHNVIIATAHGAKCGWERSDSDHSSVFSIEGTEFVDTSFTHGKAVGVFREMMRGFRWRTWADPFLGSGASLLACEQQGVTCYGMELDALVTAIALERIESSGIGVRRLEA